jgi:hypothetical protein
MIYNKQSQSYNESQGELKGNVHESQGGLPRLSLLRSDFSRDSQAEKLDCVSCSQRQLKGGHHARVHSDQMVLAMARRGGLINIKVYRI